MWIKQTLLAQQPAYQDKCWQRSYFLWRIR